MVFNAGYSIDVLCPIGFGEIDLVHEIMTTMIDIRIPHRCLLTSPATLKTQLFPMGTKRPLPGDDLSGSGRRIVQYLEELESQDWIVRWIDKLPDYASILVDREYGIAKNVSPNPEWATPYIYYESEDDIRAIADDFDRQWEVASPVEGLYRADTLIIPGHTHAVPSPAFWANFIRSLAKNPNDLRSMNPRQFEELIAELLEREGMDVQLTPPKSDGGRDILAFQQSAAGRLLHLVECKRYAKNNPVGVALVRSLYGVVESERATSGLLVTTSRFTKGAESFTKSVGYRMSLKDYDHVAGWLKKFE